MNWLLVIGFAVVVAVAHVLGWIAGRRGEVQRQVDAVLRRETRFRHPTAQADTGISALARAVGVSTEDALRGADDVQNELRRRGWPAAGGDPR